MPKFLNADLMDFGLDRIRAQIAAANNVDMLLIKKYAVLDSYATVDAAKLCTYDLVQGDLTLGNQGTNGRQVAIGAKSGNNASASTTSNEDSGTATSGGNNTLTDTGKSWGVDAYKGYKVVITGGTGSGQERSILSNTGTVLTVATNWTTNPDATSTYEIRADLHIAIVDVTDTKVLAVTDETSDQVITSGNPVSIPTFALKYNQPT